MLRYVDKNEEIQERFTDFRNCSNDRTASVLAQQVFNTVKQYQCEYKLIAQTYDRTAMMTGEHGSLKALIKVRSNKVLFIHNYIAMHIT